MNLELVDPFQKPVPDHIETTLSYFNHGGSENEEEDDDEIATCCSFYRHGHYLLVGYATGDLVVWDFYTRGVARETRAHNGYAVVSAGWARGGDRCFSAARDGRLRAWGLGGRPPPPRREGAAPGLTLVADVALWGPSSSIASAEGAGAAGLAVAGCAWGDGSAGGAASGGATGGLGYAATEDGQAFRVDFARGARDRLLGPEEVRRYCKERKLRGGRGKADARVGAIALDREGRSVFCGVGAGRIFEVDAASGAILRCVAVAGCAAHVRQIAFSRCGNWYLVLAAGDKALRLLARHDPDGQSVQDFQDVVNKTKWRACGWSSDGEHVVAGTEGDFAYALHVWSLDGRLAQTVQGPKEGLAPSRSCAVLAWHPRRRACLVACRFDGRVDVWANDAVANWSAFAPDFQELEENIEYEEKEDEFDLDAEDDFLSEQKKKDSEEQDVDVETIEKVAAFEEDSGDDEPFFLYTEPVKNQYMSSVVEKDGVVSKKVRLSDQTEYHGGMLSCGGNVGTFMNTKPPPLDITRNVNSNGLCTDQDCSETDHKKEGTEDNEIDLRNSDVRKCNDVRSLTRKSIVNSSSSSEEEEHDDGHYDGGKQEKGTRRCRRNNDDRTASSKLQKQADINSVYASSRTNDTPPPILKSSTDGSNNSNNTIIKNNDTTTLQSAASCENVNRGGSSSESDGVNFE